MNGNDGTERQLRELFAADRRADRAKVPGFGDLLRHRRAGRPRRLTALATAGSLAVAALSAWLYLQVPEHDASTAVPSASVSAMPADEAVTRAAPDGAAAGTTAGTVLPRNKIEEVPPAAPPAPTAISAQGESRATPGEGRFRATGGLAVRVVNSAGPLPGATVTISHGKGVVKTTAMLTDAQGQVDFPVLRAAQGYEVTASFPGFASRRVTQVEVEKGMQQPLTVALAEAIVERVKVTAESDVVDLAKTGTSSNFTDEFIQSLPDPGRSYQQVITLAPGVQDADGDGNPNVHGSRNRDFKAEVSGIANVDPLTGGYISMVNSNSIEEMEVITAGNGVEFSRARGGFASIFDEGPDAQAVIDCEIAGVAEEGPAFNTETYDPIQENDFLAAMENPLSTFSIDVDTAAYSNVRRFLRQGLRPPRDAVRIEEMINYFTYDDPAPSGPAPLAAAVEVAGCPWNPAHRLVRIGLKGREIERAELPGSNLVFLIDVSGSMQPSNKLPLLRSALSMLVGQLDGRDRVAIVVYAGSSGLVLPSTPGSAKSEILTALERLDAGGGTNGGQGLKLAYRTARRNFVPGGVNRVILATDGDFNLGVTTHAELLGLIEKDAANGIYLTALGFGMSNYKDATLEQLADRGNGNYAYIDTAAEARKVLVEEIGGTLVTIAKDVKIQVEFNPAQVGAYRLIGYENRTLRKEEFNDDRKDAGEIGSGHSVTALYEIAPPAAGSLTPPVDPLRYQAPAAVIDEAAAGELATLKIRYKEPEGRESRLLVFPVADDGLTLGRASADFKFAAAVAGLGMLLRESRHADGLTLEEVRALALEGLGEDPRGHRAGFIDLLAAAAAVE